MRPERVDRNYQYPMKATTGAHVMNTTSADIRSDRHLLTPMGNAAKLLIAADRQQKNWAWGES
jgi:hypothetical protein